MRLFEIMFLFLIFMSLAVKLSPPLPETLEYEQQWILANDIYLELFRRYGPAMYEEVSVHSKIEPYLLSLSNELGLCIYYRVGSASVSSCGGLPKRAAIISRKLLGKEVQIAVGK